MAACWWTWAQHMMVSLTLSIRSICKLSFTFQMWWQHADERGSDTQWSHGPYVWGVSVNSVSLFSCRGNMLMKVGPTHDGFIDPIYEECLETQFLSSVVVATCWWTWVRHTMVSLTLSMRSGCGSWALGFRWMERPSTSLVPGPSRMTLSLLGSGESWRISVWLQVTVYFNSENWLGCHKCQH